MRIDAVAAVLGLLLLGCESKQAPDKGEPAPVQTPAARAPLTDLTAASSLDAVRAAFNAHKGEARFLTLLSPT
jgi:hypothetical protein